MYKVLLYYKYVEIDDPEVLREAQFELCVRLGLKGRILIAKEGINGTVCGTEEALEEYKKVTCSNDRLEAMEFKESEAEEQVFPRLRVVVREEIVTLGVDEEVSAKDGAAHLSPEEFKKMLESDEEMYVVDARNNYESRLGKYKNALTPDIDNFRDFPKWLEDIDNLKHKKIVTYCTGGVRCEKASALMRKKGFTNVYQLDGGIVNYANFYREGDFEGLCYVFDKRRMVSVNNPEHEQIISHCIRCSEATTNYLDCANEMCNSQVIMCVQCETTYEGTCSDACNVFILQR